LKANLSMTYDAKTGCQILRAACGPHTVTRMIPLDCPVEKLADLLSGFAAEVWLIHHPNLQIEDGMDE